MKKWLWRRTREKRWASPGQKQAEAGPRNLTPPEVSGKQMWWKHMLLSENAAGNTALPWAVGIVTNEMLVDPPCISFLKCLPMLEQPWLCWGATPPAALRPPSLHSGSPLISTTLLSTFPSNGQIRRLQGSRLAKLQAFQWLHLESVAWEFFIHGHMVRLCQGFSEVLGFSFFGLVLFNIQMFSVAEVKSHGLPGSNPSPTQPTKIIAMPRRMKALRRIFSPSNTKYFVTLYMPNLSWEEVSNFLISLLRKQVGSCSQSNTWSINIWN